MFNVFFLAMYNASEVRGDVLTIGILFGCSEALGMVFGELILSMVELSNGFIIANFFIIVTSISVKWPGLSQKVIYGIFLAQIFFIGIAFNITYIL
jgi:hypothetical protein